MDAYFFHRGLQVSRQQRWRTDMEVGSHYFVICVHHRRYPSVIL